ncbi:MAG: helix-turn-helix domain-containing protein [Thermonemataceae bacterium]
MQTFQSIGSFLKAIGVKHFSEHENFFIYRIEDYFWGEQFEVGPFQYEFFELTFGSGHDVDITIGSETFKSIENTISFITPYQTSSWRINSFKEDSIGYMILFKPELLHFSHDTFDLYKQFSFFNFYTSPLLLLSAAQKDIVVKLMQTLLEEFNENREGRQEIILGAYLTILLEKVNAMFSKGTANKVFINRAEEITFLFEKALREEAHYKSRLSDYTSQLNISKVYLSEVVKKTTGKSAKVLIQEMVIYKAKTLLKQSSNPIATIAYELGFEDASNFVKYFKGLVGITPSMYRKKP